MTLGVFAQEPLQDSVSVSPAQPEPVTADSIRGGFSVRPVLLIDYGKLLSTAARFDKKYEGSLQLLINNTVELVGEYGIADLSPENAYSNADYSSSGNYFRVGAGVYSQLNPKSKIGIGLRYAEAAFNDGGTFEIASPSGLQGGYTNEIGTGENLEARWWEAVLTSESLVIFKKSVPEAKINRLVSLGFQFRMRFLIAYDRRYPIDVYSIPGYGNTLNDQRSAINLFVKIYPF